MAPLHFLRDEAGADAIEYGLIAALVAIALIVALTSMHETMVGMYRVIEAIAMVL